MKDIYRKIWTLQQDNGRRYSVPEDPTPPVTLTDRSQIAWHLNPSSLTTGAAPGGSGVFWWNGADVSTTRSYAGTKSIRLPILDQTGNGFGGPINTLLGYNPRKGDTCWFSFRIWTPSGASWDGGGGNHYIKWLRFRNSTSAATPSSDNSGALYTLQRDFGGSGGVLSNYEGYPDPVNQLLADGAYQPTLNDWTTLEYCAVFDDVAVDDVGLGETRYYRNGVQLFRRTDQKTLINTTDKMDSFNFIDYWNNTPPGAFTCYLDNICVAVKVAGQRDDTPYMALDSNGRHYIGL